MVRVRRDDEAAPAPGTEVTGSEVPLPAFAKRPSATGAMTLQDRATTNAVSVDQLVQWCSVHKATVNISLRIDAASVDQTTDSSLAFDAVWKKCFRLA